jgi:hypothetical protein
MNIIDNSIEKPKKKKHEDGNIFIGASGSRYMVVGGGKHLLRLEDLSIRDLEQSLRIGSYNYSGITKENITIKFEGVKQ